MIRSSLLFRDAIPGVTYYASGSNHAGEVLGFAEAGIHVGVSARETRDLTEQALCYAVREYKARVFVDSGAFAELGRDGSSGEAPDWPEVLGLYQRLALQGAGFYQRQRTGEQHQLRDQRAQRRGLSLKSSY